MAEHKEKLPHDPKLNKSKGLIPDEEVRKARKQIHSKLDEGIDDNEEENTEQKGFDRTSQGYKGG